MRNEGIMAALGLRAPLAPMGYGRPNRQPSSPRGHRRRRVLAAKLYPLEPKCKRFVESWLWLTPEEN
eukprot:scaffold87479_cov33-Tisochrysis_lutea.AAC.1